MSTIEFDHIAIAVQTMAAVPAFLVGVLGGRPAYGAQRDGFGFGQWEFDGGGRIEILEPVGGADFLRRFLDQRGPGVHHVTFTVPSLRDACDRAAAHGFSVTGYDDSDPGWQEAFLHPRTALGMVVQLAASTTGEKPQRWTPPPSPPDPPPAVRLRGLRTRARATERVTALWQTVLGGMRAQDDGDPMLVFAWPGSPLRIMVEIDPEGQEGPVSIDLASDRVLILDDAPHAVLGARFVQSRAE